MSIANKSKMFTSIYIPHVFSNIDSRFISNFFEKYYGEVSHVDVVSRFNKENKHYNCVYVHFHKWYDNNAVDNFLKRIEDNQSTKVVYEDPWFWLVMKNTGKKNDPSVPKKRIDLSGLIEEDLISPHVPPLMPPVPPLTLANPTLIKHVNNKGIEITPCLFSKTVEKPKLKRCTNNVKSPKEEQMVRRQYELETEVQNLLTVINQQKLTIDELYEKLESGTLQSESY